MKIQFHYTRDVFPASRIYTPVYEIMSSLELMDRLFRLRSKRQMRNLWIWLRLRKARNRSVPMYLGYAGTNCESDNWKVLHLNIRHFVDPEFVERVAVEVYDRALRHAKVHNSCYPPSLHSKIGVQ